MIYVSAVYADEGNTLVTGTDADGRTETVPADYTIFRCPDDGPIGFVNNGGEIGPYVAPEPAPVAMRPELMLTNLHVENEDVTGVTEDSGVAFAVALDPENIMAFFSEPISGYGWNVSSTSGQANISSRGEDHVIITVIDAVEPFDLSLQIYRLVA